MPGSSEMFAGASQDFDEPMTAEQTVELKTLAQRAYELDAFKPRITRAEAQKRIAVLRAKIRLLDAPPHTL
jgi:hypothetical protein